MNPEILVSNIINLIGREYSLGQFLKLRYEQCGTLPLRTTTVDAAALHPRERGGRGCLGTLAAHGEGRPVLSRTGESHRSSRTLFHAARQIPRRFPRQTPSPFPLGRKE